MHVRALGTVAQLYDKSLDLSEKVLDCLLLLHLVVLVLVFLLLEHSEVLLTGGDQVLLNVEVKGVEVVFFRVNELTLVHHKVILDYEKLLAFVVDVVLKLLLTEGAVHLHVGDLPILVKTVKDEHHDDHCGEKEDQANSGDQGVVWLQDDVRILGDTNLGECRTRDRLNVSVRIGAALTDSHDGDNEDLLLVCCIVEDIVACGLEGESEDGWREFSGRGQLCQHVLLKFNKGAVVKLRVGIDHTVSHVHWIMFGILDIEKERVTLVDAIHRIEDVRLLNNGKLSCLVPGRVVGSPDSFQHAATLSWRIFGVGHSGSFALFELRHFPFIGLPLVVVWLRRSWTCGIVRVEFLLRNPASADCLGVVQDLELKVGGWLICSREATVCVQFDSLVMARALCLWVACGTWNDVTGIVESVEDRGAVLPGHVDCCGVEHRQGWRSLSAILIANLVHRLGVRALANSENLRPFTWLSIACLIALIDLHASSIWLSSKVLAKLTTSVQHFWYAIFVRAHTAGADPFDDVIKSTHASTGSIDRRVGPVQALAGALGGAFHGAGELTARLAAQLSIQGRKRA